MAKIFNHGVNVKKYLSHAYVLLVVRIQGHLRKSMKCKKCSKEHLIFTGENLAPLPSLSCAKCHEICKVDKHHHNKILKPCTNSSRQGMFPKAESTHTREKVLGEQNLSM